MYVIKKKIKLRVTIPGDHGSDFLTLIECLGYAGLLSEVKNDETAVIIDLYPPHGLAAEVWADQNKRRMATFGYSSEIMQYT